ncbi:unnamed protein product, partial [Coregonus sp. 'balchen']
RNVKNVTPKAGEWVEPYMHKEQILFTGQLDVSAMGRLMDLKLLSIATLLGILCFCSAQQEGSDCIKANAQSCGECIQVAEKCGWCTDADFLKQGESKSARCDELKSLITKGCSKAKIENPRGSISIDKDKPVTNRKKDTFKLKFKRAEDYPIDLYYLMDLSFSMKDDLENVKNLGTDLMREMQEITSDFRIGFGSFVEKTVMPYISTTPARLLNPCTSNENCTSPFSYKNVLKLTENGQQFNSLVSKQQISGNLDSPEGGFDAIMQDAIGWRNVTRLLVFSTDAGFHFAGDGKLGGIVLPNDGKCHLENNMYTMSHYYDYPSIAHLVQKLSDNNIQTIFAVTEEFQPVYKELKNLIPKSAVGTLSSNSSNVIKLIIDSYNNNKVPEGVSIKYKSICKNGVVGTEEGGRKCSNISIGDEVRTDDLDGNCRKDNGTDICSNNGDCVVCICDANYTGSACDCSLDTSTCLAANKQICNGRGTCECGVCKCTNPKFQGPTCEICPTCPGVCTEHKECVQCRAFETGEKKDTCERDCSYFNLIRVKDRDKLPQPADQSYPLSHCKERDANDCWFYYTYAVRNDTVREVYVVETLECPAGPDIIPIVAGVVAGIVLIGLALLLIWKLLMIIHDRREFAKFEKEKMNAKWDTGENPIYKSAVTTIVNPKYEGK